MQEVLDSHSSKRNGRCKVGPNTPPPHSPSLNPPLRSPPPPGQGASGQQLVGAVVGVQNRGVPPPPVLGCQNTACCHQCLYQIEVAPLALGCISINSASRRSVSAPVTLPDNAIPPRTSLPQHRPPPPPAPAHFPVAHATVADNQQTLRYSLLRHVHVALSPGVAQSASPQPSTVPVKRDGQYRSRWSLLPDMPPAKYPKTM